MSVGAAKNNFFIRKNSSGKHDNSGDMFSISKEEMEENTACAQDAAFLNRQSIKEQGYDVTALNKKKRSREYEQELANDGVGGGATGLDLDSHPELPHMGGKADQIMFPESEVESVPESQLSSQQKEKKAKEQKKKQDKLRNNLANKYKNQPKIAPKQQPKQRPRNSPSYTPPKLKPPGG
jgi:hypothetical protein